MTTSLFRYKALHLPTFKYGAVIHSIGGPYDKFSPELSQVKIEPFESMFNEVFDAESGGLAVQRSSELYYWLQDVEGWRNFRSSAIKFSYGTMLLIGMCDYGQYVRGVFKTLRELNKHFEPTNKVLMAFCKTKAPLGMCEKPEMSIWDM